MKKKKTIIIIIFWGHVLQRAKDVLWKNLLYFFKMIADAAKKSQYVRRFGWNKLYDKFQISSTGTYLFWSPTTKSKEKVSLFTVGAGEAVKTTVNKRKSASIFHSIFHGF